MKEKGKEIVYKSEIKRTKGKIYEWKKEEYMVWWQDQLYFYYQLAHFVKLGG